MTRSPFAYLRPILRRIDRAGWREETTLHPEVLHRVASTPFADRPLPLGDAHVREQMAACNTWEQVEYVYRVKGDMLIDPRTGFVIPRSRRFIPTSLPYAYQSGPPSTMRIIAARAGLVRTLDLQRVISFRDVNEKNYFHFLNDVLCKIPLLERLGLLDAPIVIGGALRSKAFYQYCAPLLERAGLQIIDQGNNVIRAQEVVFAKCMPLCRPYLERVLDLLEAPPPAQHADRSVFLTRRSGDLTQRIPANVSALESMLSAVGFEVHDTGALSMPQQMELLAGTTKLVLVHGAAGVNMVFRREAPMRVLELFPEGSVPPHYYWSASIFGHPYAGMRCGPADTRGRFEVPLKVLKAHMERMFG